MKSWFINAQGQVRNGWKALAFMVASTACFIAIGLSRGLIPPAIKAYLPNVLLGVVAAWLVSLAAVRLERTSLAGIGLKLDRRFMAELGAGFVGGLGLIGLAAAVIWLLGGIDFVRAPQATGASPIKSLATFFGVAIFEELTMRGYALQRTMRGLGTGWGLFLFAVIFAAAHLPGNTGMDGAMLMLALLNIFMAAYLLSLCYLRTGSLALPIGVHWSWNWLQATLGFGVSGTASHGWWMPVFHQRPVWLTGGEFGVEASVVATVVEALAIVALVRWQGTAGRRLRSGGPRPFDAAVEACSA